MECKCNLSNLPNLMASQSTKSVYRNETKTDPRYAPPRARFMLYQNHSIYLGSVDKIDTLYQREYRVI